MPELPEVETVVRSLSPAKAQSIRRAQVHQYKLRIGSEVPADFRERVTGETVKNISRTAKYILITLSNEETIVVHLGMSGNFLLKAKKYKPIKHDHVILELDSHTLVFHDPRRFGLVELVKSRDITKYFSKKGIGIDALSPSFTPQYLKEKLAGRKTNIKQTLLNQKIVSGLGNIYVSEALFLAGISPEKRAEELDMNALKKLVPAVKSILRKAIKAGGTTLRDHKDADGSPGYFSQELLVYGREGKPCKICGEPIKKIIQGGRSTFFCPNCQK